MSLSSLFNYGNPAPCGALLVILHWNTSRLRLGGRSQNRQTRCQCRCHTTNCYTYLYKWRCTNTLSGHFTFFLLVFIYLFFRLTTDRCPKQKPSSVSIGKSSRTLFSFFLPFLCFYILPSSSFFSVFFLSPCIPLFLLLSFFLPFFLPSLPSSFLTSSWFWLRLASLRSVWLRSAQLYSTSLGFIQLSLVSLGYFGLSCLAALCVCCSIGQQSAHLTLQCPHQQFCVGLRNWHNVFLNRCRNQ